MGERPVTKILVEPERIMQITKIQKYTGISVFSYLLLLSISYSYGDSAYQPIFTLLTGTTLWLLITNLCIRSNKYDTKKILFGILLIGGIIRYSWAIFVPTQPFNDFLIFFHENAIKLSHGTAVLTKNIGYTLLLSGGYRLYPNVLTGKLINATASTLSILIIYLIGARLVNKETGLSAALLFAILPNEILMVNVLGTEVVGTAIGCIIVFFVLCSADFDSSKPRTMIFLAGIFYGLGLTVRSSYLFFFPAILFWIITKSDDYKTAWKAFARFCSGLIIGLTLVLAGYSISTNTKLFSLEPLKGQDAFPLLSGTNIETSGTWSMDDTKIYTSWPAEDRDDLARIEAIKRITSNPIGFLAILPRKFFILMGPNDYGIYWGLHDIHWGMINLVIGLFSQSIYVFILFFCLYAFKGFENSPISLVVLTLVLFTLVPHAILEVQGRYHHYIMPFLVLLSALGIQRANSQSTVATWI